jgi:hypothetical protein
MPRNHRGAGSGFMSIMLALSIDLQKSEAIKRKYSVVFALLLGLV